MPDNKQPIEYYVAEAQRLGLSEEQIRVIGSEPDGESFREHIANAQDMTDAELRDVLNDEWQSYTADPASNDRQGFGSTSKHEPLDDEDDEFGAIDDLDIDEDAVEEKRNGGGEALDDGEADCEGCKI